jgi:hypothetical protein
MKNHEVLGSGGGFRGFRVPAKGTEGFHNP